MTEITTNPRLGVLAQAFSKAASDTGVSFDFLVKTAARESSLQPEAEAKNSSAAGLFQFVEQTWLAMVSRHGAAQGLASEAASIQQTKSGRYSVTGAAMRDRILKLRYDPQVATAMAAKLTQENGQALQQKLGRAPTDGELYVAHFMGAGRAGELLQAAIKTPGRIAQQMFPQEAAANPAIFSTSKGNARSVADVVKNLMKAHTSAPDPSLMSLGKSDVSLTPIAAFVGQRSFTNVMANTMVRSPLLQLSPTIIRLLSELSAPSTTKDDIKK